MGKRKNPKINEEEKKSDMIGCSYDYREGEYVLREPEYIKMKIKNAGCKYAQAAELMGISEQWLKELINGRAGEPSLWPYDAVINLCIVLGMTTRQMFFSWNMNDEE